MTNSYSVMADYYEFLQSEVPYDKWLTLIKKGLGNLLPSNIGVDVGCGTGIITRKLSKENFSVTGIDLSQEMLSVAIEKSDGKIPFLLMDASKLKGFSNLAFITAVNDVINYLSPKKVKEFFTRAYNALDKKGRFIFDLSTRYKLENILGNNTFSFNSNNVSYIWENYLQKNRVLMDLTFFILDKTGKYEKKEEFHTQYIHDDSELISILEQVGFKKIIIKNENGKKPKSTDDRLFFICEK